MNILFKFFLKIILTIIKYFFNRNNVPIKNLVFAKINKRYINKKKL
jgi:hypothetical protein